MRNKVNGFWSVTATGLGLGYSPLAPGTAGAAGAMIPVILLLRFAATPYLWLGGLILIFGVLGCVAADKVQSVKGGDPKEVVIDEIVGMWISLMWIGSGWIALLSAFVLFRFFDIVKPLGIRRLEHLRGGYGIMADDVAAGLAANLVVQAGFLVYGWIR